MKSNTVLPKKIILKQQKSVEDRNGSKTDERLDDFGTKFPLSKVFGTQSQLYQHGISSYYMIDISLWGHDAQQN